EVNGRVKVGDFGLAHSLLTDAEEASGRFEGTPMFAPPEQHRGEELDVRADVYAVSATLFFLLTGEPPFKGKDLTTIMTRAASEPLPSVRRGHPEIPPALDRVVQRGLERDRTRRWSDLPKLRTALSRFLPMRLSSGDLGPRFCAYLIDMLLV